MNRLRDDVGEDPVAERGIAMLRGIAATPAMPDLKRKVWGAIQQQRLRAPAPRPLRRLRVAAVAAVVLCLAGTAGAVLSQRWIKLAATPVAVQPTAAHTPSLPRTRARAASPSPAAPTMEGAAPTAAAMASPIAPAPASAAVPVPRSFPHPTRKTARAGGRSAPAAAKAEVRADLGAASARASERERAEVLDALVALRRDRDPERAGRLLGGYLDAHPHGALREEAMALGIEAAAARGDEGAAQRLARAYQSAYPGGRFGAFARQRATGAPEATQATQATEY